MNPEQRKQAEEIYYTLCDKYLDIKDRSEIVFMAMEEYTNLPRIEITEEEIMSIAELDSTYEPEMAAFIRGFNACLSRLSERKEQKTTEEA